MRVHREDQSSWTKLWHIAALSLAMLMAFLPTTSGLPVTMSACPGSTLCRCGKDDSSRQVVQCDGNKIRQTLNQEQLPETIDKLTITNFLFTNLSSERFPEGINVKKIHFKQNEMWAIRKDTFVNFEHIEEVSVRESNVFDIKELMYALYAINTDKYFTVVLQDLRFVTPPGITLNVTLNERVISLNLARNNIGSLNTAHLLPFPALENVSLANNNVNKILSNASVTSLKKLDLSHNKLTNSSLRFCVYDNKTTAAQSLFPNLRVLNLSDNFITKIGNGIWDCLTSVETLDLSENQIAVVHVWVLKNMVSLKNLILKKNWIGSITERSGIVPGKYPPLLKYLDLSENQLVPFMPYMCPDENEASVHVGIQRLNLRYNRITELTRNHTWCLTNLTHLYLGWNAIKTIKDNSFSHFTNLQSLTLERQVHGIQSIMKYAFNGTKLWELDLTGNFLTFGDNSSNDRIFTSTPYLTSLKLSNNYFRKTEDLLVRMLANVTNLKTLKINRASFHSFPYHIFGVFKSLKHVYMDYNTISSIYFPNDFKIQSTNVSVISIRSNKIKFDNKTLFPAAITRSLKFLDLGSNYFDCSCNANSRWFRNQIHVNSSGGFLQNITLIHWPSLYKCTSPSDEHGILLMDFHKSDADCRPPDPYVFVYITLGCSTFVFIVLSAVVFWNRWYIQFYWHKVKKGLRKNINGDTERAPLIDKSEVNFDAFVVYHATDAMFVRHSLCQLLEDRMGYRLLIWDRDGNMGSRTEAYLNAIDSSRHVIVVMSNKMMRDPWCKFQAEIANTSKIEASEGMHTNKNIFIVLREAEVNLESAKRFWCMLMTKKYCARWCDTQNSIRRTVFIEDVKSVIGQPMQQ